MMSNITITIDANHLLRNQEATVQIEQLSDYLHACLLLRDAFSTGKRVSIVVHQPTVAVWLSRLAIAYGDERITLRHYTPRDALTERWRLTIPSSVSDREIIQAGLINISLMPREGQTFSEALLEHFYGNVFTYKTFPIGKVAMLLNALQQAKQEQVHNRPIVIKILNERLTLWEDTANSEGARLLVNQLKSHPDSLRRDIVCYKILQNYPLEVGKKVIDEEIWDIFHKVHIATEDVILTQEDVSFLLPQIEYYLTAVSRHVANTNDVNVLLEQMSGYLEVEFRSIEQLLEQKPQWLTATLLRSIEQRFRPLKDIFQWRLTALRRLVPPNVPQKPEMSWDVETWLAWVRDDYMPYYSWLDAQYKQDNLLESYASLFADWFYHHFTTIKHGFPEHFAFNALYQERENMTVEGRVTLILVLDNMNFVYFDDLCSLFNQRDFSLHGAHARPVLSLIPTATEIGKVSVMTGRGDQHNLTSDRRSLITKEWKPVLKGKTILYLENIGELQHLREQTHDVYFLNYLPIDKILHQDVQDIGRLHAEVIHEYLTSLVEAVALFAKRFSIENRLSIYVISDHGSTRIAQQNINILDKSFFKGFALDEHHRFITLSDEKLKALPQSVEAQCYVIDRKKFKTSKNYLIARQYYRFITTKEHFYVHGGLTPEEVVVPFAHFMRKQIDLNPLTLRLITNQFRYAIKSRVMFEVGNPNSSSIELLSFRLIDTEAEEVHVETIAPKQAIRVEMLTLFRRIPGASSKRSLTLRLHYEYQGRPCAPQEETFDITIKSIMERTDDEFDI